MARTVSIGAQDFEYIISNNCFYVDKTLFIKEWWESDDIVTLITRPRRFGKTLNINMLERFFSVKYKGQGEIFEGLDIWREEKYRVLQGTYPVIFISFAGIKPNNYVGAREQIFQCIEEVYLQNEYLKDCEKMSEKDKINFDRIGLEMSDSIAAKAINQLSKYMYQYYGKKAIILLDEYDTPLQEAYTGGYWNELVSFIRNLFNNTFKTNPYLERAVMTGITRISKESMFSDLNNLMVITVTSNKYASCFGFAEEEVFAAMDEFGMTNKDEVKRWYDGFTIGNLKDIYNPWSIINFLNEGKLKTYWANTSSNRLASSLLKKADKNTKMQFEELLKCNSIKGKIDEEIVFDLLDKNENAIWSLLLTSGYLKVINIAGDIYELELTNYEVLKMFANMIDSWFGEGYGDYNDFIKSLLNEDVEEMNEYMNQIAEIMFSSFAGGKKPSARTAPERFYHGFVLGLLVDLAGRYEVTSNRESGFGRYDVMLKPLNQKDNAIIIEFKIFNPKKEKSLEETVHAALNQIGEKKYEQVLICNGIGKERIRKYGFAFKGKKVLIG